MPGPLDIYPQDGQSHNWSDTLGVGSSWGTWFPMIMDIGGSYGFNRLTDISMGLPGGKRGIGRVLGFGMPSAQSERLRAVSKVFGRNMERTGMSGAQAMWRREILIARGASTGTGWGTAWNRVRTTGDYRMAGKVAGALSVAKGYAQGIFAAQIASMAVDLGAGFMNAAVEWRPRAPGHRTPDFGTNYFDSSQAFTQRQRALMSIHNSQLTTRAAIGNEASFMQWG